MKKNTKKIKIFSVSLVFLFFVSFGYFKINKIFAETSAFKIIQSVEQFSLGSLYDTEILGVGDEGYVQLEGGGGPDNTIYVRNIAIDNTNNSNNLEEYQIFIDNFDTASLISEGKLQNDCDDLRFTNSSGTELNYSIVGNTCNSNDTEIWVKVDLIGASSITNISMYYGSPSALAGQNEIETFSYSEERTVAYLLDGTISSLEIISLEADNSVTHNGVTREFTNEMDTNSFGSLSNYSEIKAKKLFEAKNNTASDMMVPVSWAGTEFLLSNRNSSYNMNLTMVAPWENSTIQIYVNGSACGGERTVTSSGLEVSSCGNSGYDVVRVVSTNGVPFLLNKTDAGGNDPMPIHPADLGPWYGFDSTQYLIKAGPSGADYRWIDSGDTSETNPANINSNNYENVNSAGDSYYSDETVRTRSVDNKIGVQTFADSDGGDGTTHMLRRDFGTKFGSSFSTDFIAIVSDQPAVCTTYRSNGSSYQTQTLESNNTLVYGLPDNSFGTGSSSTYLSGKWKVECDKPVMVVTQYSDDEQNMFSYPMMRQFTYPTSSGIFTK